MGQESGNGERGVDGALNEYALLPAAVVDEQSKGSSSIGTDLGSQLWMPVVVQVQVSRLVTSCLVTGAVFLLVVFGDMSRATVEFLRFFATCHTSRRTRHMSLRTRHMSLRTCHMSLRTHHMSQRKHVKEEKDFL